ncbi:RNA-directed DNA polymerase, eukaryota [Tanacetum coccineum]
MAIFHDMIEETIEVFMDDFSVFKDSFSSCLSYLDMMLKRCEDTNLVLIWEKCHFMVKEGIVLGHKISKSEIEVDRAKVDVITKLPHSASVNGVRSAVLGKHKTKHFHPIHYASKTMTDAQAHYTTTEKELLAVVYAFEKFWSYLVLSKTIVYTDQSALKYLLAKQDAKLRLLRLDNFVEIPSGESKVHIEVLSVLWGNRLPIPDGSLPLSSRLKGGGNGYIKKDKNEAKMDKSGHEIGRVQEIKAKGVIIFNGSTHSFFQEYNAMLKLAKKLKILKEKIRSWVKDKKEKAHVLKNSLKKKLADIDSVLDKGEATSDVLEDKLDTMNSLTKLEKMESLELAQKAKIKWSIEGDENSKYFHGIIYKKRNNLAIRGIIVDGVWIEDPSVVKTEFMYYFRNRFDSPCTDWLTLDMEFPNVLSYEQAQDLEIVFSKVEIKQAVWDCGLDKSPGPDGFTFGFYRKFWSLLEDDVVDAVCYFFNNGFCLKGINSSFIALILKSQGANMVKDFRPIRLIGSIYKIIVKLLANRLVTVLDGLVNEVQSAFIANR